MTATYSCPICGDDVTVGHTEHIVYCPECEATLSVDRDAEFRDGHWRDLTTLTPHKVEAAHEYD
jgi:endogenous inhibitor of DNA gyrase (YacG/DUF329 family)